MVDQEQLAQDFDHVSRVYQDLLKQQATDPLVDEFFDRFDAASMHFKQAESCRGSKYAMCTHDSARHHMACRLYVTRCLDIITLMDRLEAGYPVCIRQYRVMGLGENRYILRWLVSRLSWLRSKLFGYPDYYSAPPLWETLRLAGSESSQVPAIRARIKSWMKG